MATGKFVHKGKALAFFGAALLVAVGAGFSPLQAAEGQTPPLPSSSAAPLKELKVVKNVPTIEVEELRDLMKSPNPPVLLDVREDAERAIAVIPGDRHIPLGALDARAAELPKDKPIVVYCHRGNRSARAALLLLDKGFTNVKSLSSGIQAWSTRIDPTVKTY